ncbi:hypothetical protein J6590_056109 [Homalodisca vitripennis]|nr:hypothetical protein J6590_056109 [Homalodisca vitripennis]
MSENTTPVLANVGGVLAKADRDIGVHMGVLRRVVDKGPEKSLGKSNICRHKPTYGAF